MTEDNLCPIFLQIAPEDIVYLKSILESYEELGIIRTLDRQKGEIVILATKDMEQELRDLLNSLHEEVSFRIIPTPQGLCEDWLLSEYLPEE